MKPMEKADIDAGNQMKYSIWDTATDENLDITKANITSALSDTNLESKLNHRKDEKQP